MFGVSGIVNANAQEFPSIDGHNHHLGDPLLNAADTQLHRAMGSMYDDQISQMAGANRPNPRSVSNAVARQDVLLPNSKGLSDMFWAWGQFIDHDIDLTEGTNTGETAHISVPTGDPWFDPDSTGTKVISFTRSAYDSSSGYDPENARQQVNQITGWIDASNVYGSDLVRANALRTLDGTGKLKTSSGNLLPFNMQGLPNAGGTGPHLFLAGDVRANEQVGLTALHTVFVREHNRLAEILAVRYPSLDGDRIYNEARLMVAALIQSITYEEFLPALLGGHRELGRYTGYKSTRDPRIVNMFSTAVFRLGHSLLSPQLLRTDASGETAAEGNLSLRRAFFSPQEITQHGVESVLRGLAAQQCQELDPYVIDDVRNFLFGDPGSGGFDLASLNIQRGRDHGLPSYNDVREAAGFPRAVTFADISSDPVIQSNLASVYNIPDDLDLWVGGLAEDHYDEAVVGPTFYAILKEQFQVLRDADRFWYEISLTSEHLDILGDSKLGDVIRRNSSIGSELQENVFYAR